MSADRNLATFIEKIATSMVTYCMGRSPSASIEIDPLENIVLSDYHSLPEVL